MICQKEKDLLYPACRSMASKNVMTQFYKALFWADFFYGVKMSPATKIKNQKLIEAGLKRIKKQGTK